MQVKELGHAVLYVHDIARSAAFYRDILGWTQIGPADSRVPAAAFSSGRTHHELLLLEVGDDVLEIPRGRRVGLYHLGIKIGDSDDELREAVSRCREAGVRIVGLSDHTVTHSLYVLDPDGNELELYIDVPGLDWRQDPSLVMSPVRPLVL
ncbi:MAG: VOC family protein [Candidatus Dormibacteraeota bacterium]|nr:VOC family protein [Candidatus Dormibacteraeota bacterium]